MKLFKLADKFAMKLGLESRPAPSDATTTPYDYEQSPHTSEDQYAEVLSDELSEEDAGNDFDQAYNPASLAPAYLADKNFPFNRILQNMKFHSSRLNDMMDLKDFSGAVLEIETLQELLSTLAHYILNKDDSAGEESEEPAKSAFRLV